MLSRKRVIVRTAEQPVSAIGDRMGVMREWLDYRGIQLTDFRVAPLTRGSVAFDASFRDPQEAELFWAAFG
jgi:hypothetical protein